MRTVRFIPAALIVAIVLAAPAGAEDQSVSVPDYEFNPKNVSIGVGDTVTWNFQGPSEHTATSNGGQPDSWDSPLEGKGGTFTHTFAKPGKYQYYCRPHAEFMKGAITVGTDPVAKSFTSAKVRGAARSVSASVRLKEDAKVTLSVKGPKRKKVVKSLKKGKRTITVRKLSAGSYKVTLVAQDAFDKKTTKRAKATVG